MELYEAMSTQRAVRKLRPDAIPDDVLERVLTAATWAPSGGNAQAWRIVAAPAHRLPLAQLLRMAPQCHNGARRPAQPAVVQVHAPPLAPPHSLPNRQSLPERQQGFENGIQMNGVNDKRTAFIFLMEERERECRSKNR